MLATGVDLIEIERVRRGLERYGARFADRFFTPREQAQCAGRAASLAGRFAVKEAVGKALGTGIGDVGWKDIEVLNDDRGRPHLTLHNAAEQLAAERGLSQWAISLSHTGTHAVGLAVAQGGGLLPRPSGEGWGEGSVPPRADRPSPNPSHGEGDWLPRPSGEGWGEGSVSPRADRPSPNPSHGERDWLPRPSGEGWGEGSVPPRADRPSPNPSHGEGDWLPRPSGEGWGEGPEVER